jgi:hypothetical protein
MASYLVEDITSRAEPKSRAEELNQQQSDTASSYVHHLVKVESAAQKGLGLFATGLIQEGEIVAWESADYYQGKEDARPGKKLMTWAQIEERWPDKRERDHFVAYSYQVGEDLFLIPLREDDLVITTYQNHSCDPNTWWADDYTLVARRNIYPGEEVTFDYSTSESLENPEMPECYCGSPHCRGKLEPHDYLKPELIASYGSHFVSYLRDRQMQHYGGSLPVTPHSTSPVSSPINLRKVEEELQKAASALEQASHGVAQYCDEPVNEHTMDNYNMHGRKS